MESQDLTLLLSALATAAGCGYLLGAIPFGLLICKLAGLGDIREMGSGNIGATNVLRTGRKDLAAATLIMDSGKGAMAALLALVMTGQVVFALAAGAGAVVGHNFPVWLKFKGGKGVATTLGVFLATLPIVGAFSCLTWLMIAFLYRYSSVAALGTFILTPIYAYMWGHPIHAAVFAGLGLLGIVRHKANIVRLFNGEEDKIGAKKKAD